MAFPSPLLLLSKPSSNAIMPPLEIFLSNVSSIFLLVHKYYNLCK